MPLLSGFGCVTCGGRPTNLGKLLLHHLHTLQDKPRQNFWSVSRQGVTVYSLELMVLSEWNALLERRQKA
jgi:hypothetical protein